MTPKEQYEARKAERQRRAGERLSFQEKRDAEDADAIDLIDRGVTALERIADALTSLAARTKGGDADG